MNLFYFISVTVFFVLVNIVAASIMLGLGMLAQSEITGADEIWFIWFVIGFAGVAGSTGFGMWLIKFIARRRW